MKDELTKFAVLYVGAVIFALAVTISVLHALALAHKAAGDAKILEMQVDYLNQRVIDLGRRVEYGMCDHER